MNRLEALHILGLGDDATADEIKTAYKETAQILHPDKFASNKKLQERATEQFKNLQEAYAYLTSGKGTKGQVGRGGRSSAAQEGSRANIEARLAGIAAARAQLVAQRDEVSDERRNGMIMAAIGAVVALFTIRRPMGLFGFVAAAATTATVWGVVQVVSANRTLDTLNAHLRKLNQEKKLLLAELDEL
ncbi:MAG: J domain-containing protein [Eggerthellaceae bacterium]|nr:J domain-containing protein [Eggerthellaceae bacterium]